MTFPLLETPRLILSELSDADDQAVFALFSDASVVAYYDLAAFTEVAQARTLIQLFGDRYTSGNGIRWAIRLKHTGALIGTCGFNTWSPKMRNAVIGYDLMRAHWRQGYAREAVSAILAAAFNGVLPCGPLYRVQADTVPGNTASETLLRSLGFREEGLRRAAGFWKGEFHDLKCFGLLEPEFSAAPKSIFSFAR